jgi:hypothetical protein
MERNWYWQQTSPCSAYFPSETSHKKIRASIAGPYCTEFGRSFPLENFQVLEFNNLISITRVLAWLREKVWGQLRLASEGWKAVLAASESDHTTEIYLYMFIRTEFVEATSKITVRYDAIIILLGNVSWFFWADESDSVLNIPLSSSLHLSPF